MRFMGIDYGRKRVGVALSDETGTFAQPFAVWDNDQRLAGKLLALAQERKVSGIVLGESKNFQGQANPIMKPVAKFKLTLEAETGLPVYFEPELLTSAQAERGAGKEDLDARAAALILQSYLDRSHAHRI